mgnify:FL=1
MVRSENVAAFVTVFIIILIIIIPLIFAANALINESVLFLREVRDIDLSKFDDAVDKFFKDSNLDVNAYIKDLLNKLSLTVAKKTSDFIVGLPQKILEFFVMLFTMFYLFKQGARLCENIKEHIPFHEAHKKNIAESLSAVVYASLYGLVVAGFVQGALGALGLWIFDVQSPILWGLVIVILSMLPLLGTSLVWFPAAVYKFFTGEIWNGVGLFLYGLIILSTIDNIIRPKLIGSKAKIHPVLVLLGVIGGLKVFGFLGILLGPVILSVLTVFLSLYIEEKKGKG